MSDNERGKRDSGMVLPELLIGVVLTGMLVSVLAFCLIAVLRQSDNSKGRLNNARSEVGVGLWMPSDLASAGENVVTDPAASPCFGACPAGVNVGGSNTMLLTWTSQTTDSNGQVITQTTKVSYRYTLVGDEYQLIRVECVQKGSAVTCRQNVVLHDLDGPPPGTDFVAGVTSPFWVITVTVPDAPDSTGGEPVDPGFKSKNAQKVLVTINGGGDAAGAGGGLNQINLSAGGTNRELIDATSLQGAPNLIAARSRCGGHIAVVVDESASISTTDYEQVRAGIRTFVTNFAGTPTKIKIVPFDSLSSTLGSGAGWSRYFNMLVQTDVDELFGLINTGLSSKVGVSGRGSTNWEDALFRTFKNEDGTTDPVLPGLVVFFTDGVPTYDRLNRSSSTAPAVRDVKYPADYPLATGSGFNTEAFDRADAIAKQFRDSDGRRIIGVGVGEDIYNTQKFVTGWNGYHYEYSRKFHYSSFVRWYHMERSFHYQKSFHYQRAVHYQRSFHYEKGFYFTTYQRGYHIEKYDGSGSRSNDSNWVTDGSANSSTNLDTDHRVRWTQPYSLNRTITLSAAAIPDKATSWTATSGSTNQVMFNTENNFAQADNYTDATDEWIRSGKTYGTTAQATDWEDVTLAVYNAATTAKRITFENFLNTSLDYWENSTLANYNAAATTARRIVVEAANGTNDYWENVTQATYNSTSGSLRRITYEAPNGVNDMYENVTDAIYSASATWRRVQYEAPNGVNDYWENDPTATSSTAPDSSHRLVFAAPFSLSKSVSSSSAPTANNATSWSTTTSGTNKALFDTQNNMTLPATDSSDGWTASKSYSSPYDWTEPSDGAGYDKDNTSWVRTKVYTEPYSAYENITTDIRSDKVLAKLVSGTELGTPAVTDANGNYTNAQTANMYVLPEWSKFSGAMEAVALAECGGTLTLQTRIGTAAAADPFTYQKTAVVDSTGTDLGSDMTIVTTTKQFPSGTFDLSVPRDYVTVTILPQNLSSLTGYHPVSWSCKAGVTPRTFTVVPIPNSVWTGVQVKVAANEAVSCIQTVSR